MTHIQVSQETDKVVWYSHLFKNFPQFVVIHTVKGFNIVDEAAVAAAENEEKLKSLLTKVKEESEKVGSKLNIQKAKILASGPITLWQIEGEKVEAVTDFIFLGFKITVDGDCSHEIEKTLAPWKERYDQPRQCIKKQTSL